MTPFVEKFPDLGGRETRTLIVPPGNVLPSGEYALVEMYCNEPGCDCRRVIILVLRPDTGWDKIWASIGYGWESLDFYREWGGAPSDAVEMKGPYLDPLNPQSQYSEVLLDLFCEVIESPAYVERLQRHYLMFRESIDRTGNREMNRIGNRRKRLRDPRRGRRH